ncbi:hypothetical protein PAPYR_4738 [Paratrimastix pyriformis]|uniref:Uncharacterized protein n=1 Tax=Paratrimastix pyriformis TaxID=342808 RepID=A0ABQ8UNY6_9EUKA|nr:hypothetical protein PAPYR_4738 [Paratrimastix pyriformis]
MPNRDGIGSGLDIIRKTITMEKVDAMVREIAVFEAGTFQFWRANFWKDGIIGAGNAPWPVGIIMVENAACREKYPVDGEAYARMKEMMTRQAGVQGVHFGDVGKTEDCCAMMAREVRKKVSRRLECLCNPRTYHKGECELAAEMGILDLAQLIQFICGATIFNLESSSKPVTVSRVSMATPVPARPVASVNPSTASPQSGLCPKSPSTVKQPPGKVTAHCIDPSAAPLQLGGGTSRPPQGLLATPKGASLCPTDLGLKGSGAARVPAGPDGPRRRDFGWWIRQQHAPMFVFRTSTRWYMGTRMPNAQEVPM